MSHEIRSPLSAIVGISRQLSKTELNVKQREYVDVLSNSSNHLMAVINDILDYSKLSTGKLRFDSRNFSPREVMNEVVKLLRLKLTKKDCKFYRISTNRCPKTLLATISDLGRF